MALRRGLALVLVVATLGILAVLGSAFVILGRLERRAASQRIWGTRALLLARSGLEDARARLDLMQDPAYGGEDWNGDGLLNAGPETAEQTFRPGSFEREACPAAHAMRPSFFKAVGGNPWSVRMNGKLRGYSGRFGSDAATWSIRAIPDAGFFLNGGDPASAPGTGYNAVLRRVLGNLAQAVDEEQGGIDGAPVSLTDGTNLVDLRPQAGWSSWAQVREALGGSQAKLEALRPYLALNARVDRKVIQPNASSTLAGQDCESWTAYKLAHRTPSTGLPAPDFERIGSRIVGRAPVSLAWARKRKPALIALLGGLRGVYLDTSTAWDTPPRTGTIRDAQISLTWGPGDDAHQLANQIASSASDLGTWQRFNAYVDSLLVSGTGDVALAQKDILKANFNPNTGLNKFNPCALLWRTVDKSDLALDQLGYSTELSLLPLHGHEVECVGRALDAGGRVMGRRTLRADLAGPRALRLDTQKEFVCGDLGNPDLAGDESSPRIPGFDSPYLTSSRGAGKTWGHKLAGLDGFGAGLQSYPEPCTDPGTGLSINPADWDGRLELATVETPLDAFYGVTSTTCDMKMLARFDQRLDLDEHDGLAYQNLTDTSQVSTGELGNSLLHGTKPSTLYPDGAYAEWGSAPAWQDLGNANGSHGVISFWMKRFAGGFHNYVNWTNRLVPGDIVNGDSPNQVFMFGSSMTSLVYASSFICFFETDVNVADFDSTYKWEMIFNYNDSFLPPVGYHGWGLISLYYDFAAVNRNATCEVVLQNGFFAPPVFECYPCARDNQPNMNPDITRDDAFGPHTISLGARPDRPIDIGLSGTGRNYHNGADATFDELAVYDFGPTETLTASFASARFDAGRYYKESAYPAQDGLRQAQGALRNAGEWFSAPVDLGTVRIRGLASTVWVPAWLKAPAVFGPIGDPGPDPRIGLELAHPSVQVPAAAGTDYKPDLTGRPITRFLTGDRWEALDRAVRGPFRLHAVFQPNVAVPASKAILEPLALDDITVVYRDVVQPQAFGWREGEEQP